MKTNVICVCAAIAAWGAFALAAEPLRTGSDDTARLQALLDSGKGRVEFPDGTFTVSKTLRIGSDTHLVCSPRTILRLADGANCPLLANRGSEPGGRDRNIRVDGGVWDGNNVNQKRGPARLPNCAGGGDVNQLVVFAGVENLHVDGMTLKDPDSYSMELTDVVGFTVENLVFDCNNKTPNQDGLHVDGYARDGLIRNLRGHTNDDMVALNSDEGAWRSPSNDIVNVTIDGIYGGDDGFTAVRLLSRNARLKDVVIRNVYGRYKFNGVSFTHWAFDKHVPGMGHFDNVTIENMFASSCMNDITEPWHAPWAMVYFQDKVESVGKVTVRNLHRVDPPNVTNTTHTVKIGAGVKIDTLILDGVDQRLPDSKPLILRDPTAVVRDMRVVNCAIGEKDVRCDRLPELAVDGRSVKVEQRIDGAFARFDMTAPVDVVVTPMREFLNCAVEPASKNVVASHEGYTARFKLATPGRYVASFDGGRDKLVLVAGAPNAPAGAAGMRGVPDGCDPAVMSEKYWKLWNGDVQKRIDADIERNRKATGDFVLEGAAAGTDVAVEQVSHEFLFGAHSFRVNRTGRRDVNEKYVRVFGELFNAATVPVHWNRIEPQPGCVRWKTEWTDTEEFFNTHDMATCFRHSPCAPLEQTIDFFRSRGVRMVAHPLVWGSYEWVWPHWVYNQYCPAEEKRFLNLPLQDVADRTPGLVHCPQEWAKRFRARWAEVMRDYTAEEVGKACPVFCRNLKALQDRRIRELAARIGDRIDEWVVVNESADDWHGDGETGEPLCMSAEYGPMPGDYAFRAFKTADEAFPRGVKFILNDCRMDERFVRQIKAMQKKGLRLDKIGAQMHVFSDEGMRRLVAGEPIGNKVTPEDVWDYFGQLSELGVPLFLSEITIPSLGNSTSGLQQQAIAAYNLYRIWFSLPAMTGITWWHTIDLGSNAGGIESAQSGIFTARGERKPAYWALDQLVNREWKTKTAAKVDGSGRVRFRGFRGDYRLSWKDAEGRERTKIVKLH